MSTIGFKQSVTKQGCPETEPTKKTFLVGPVHASYKPAGRQLESLAKAVEKLPLKSSRYCGRAICRSTSDNSWSVLVQKMSKNDS